MKLFIIVSILTVCQTAPSLTPIRLICQSDNGEYECPNNYKEIVCTSYPSECIMYCDGDSNYLSIHNGPCADILKADNVMKKELQSFALRKGHQTSDDPGSPTEVHPPDNVSEKSVAQSLIGVPRVLPSRRPQHNWPLNEGSGGYVQVGGHWTSAIGSDTWKNGADWPLENGTAKRILSKSKVKAFQPAKFSIPKPWPAASEVMTQSEYGSNRVKQQTGAGSYGVMRQLLSGYKGVMPQRWSGYNGVMKELGPRASKVITKSGYESNGVKPQPDPGASDIKTDYGSNGVKLQTDPGSYGLTPQLWSGYKGVMKQLGTRASEVITKPGYKSNRVKPQTGPESYGLITQPDLGASDIKPDHGTNGVKLQTDPGSYGVMPQLWSGYNGVMKQLGPVTSEVTKPGYKSNGVKPQTGTESYGLIPQPDPRASDIKTDYGSNGVKLQTDPGSYGVMPQLWSGYNGVMKQLGPVTSEVTKPGYKSNGVKPQTGTESYGLIPQPDPGASDIKPDYGTNGVKLQTDPGSYGVMPQLWSGYNGVMKQLGPGAFKVTQSGNKSKGVKPQTGPGESDIKPKPEYGSNEVNPQTGPGSYVVIPETEPGSYGITPRPWRGSYGVLQQPGPGVSEVMSQPEPVYYEVTPQSEQGAAGKRPKLESGSYGIMYKPGSGAFGVIPQLESESYGGMISTDDLKETTSKDFDFTGDTNTQGSEVSENTIEPGISQSTVGMYQSEFEQSGTLPELQPYYSSGVGIHRPASGESGTMQVMQGPSLIPQLDVFPPILTTHLSIFLLHPGQHHIGLSPTFRQNRSHFLKRFGLHTPHRYFPKASLPGDNPYFGLI